MRNRLHEGCSFDLQILRGIEEGGVEGRRVGRRGAKGGLKGDTYLR